ncbi:MAG: class I SAM-dependent methyltransferase [Acidimicrobiales bacterium]
MTDRVLQSLYEDPATPLSSGVGRATLQAAMLAAAAAGAGRPLRGIDIGCGDGMATEIALATCRATAGADLRIAGFDWSMAALSRASKRGIPVARGSTDSGGLPLADCSVDIVIMSEIIEHLVDTDAALAEARRVLVAGGRLLLSTPNLAAWYNRALLAVGVQPLFTEVSLHGIYGRPGREVVGHLRVMTKRALMELLTANGFQDLSVAGAPYHDVPKLFRPLDRLACKTPALASILLASATKPG